MSRSSGSQTSAKSIAEAFSEGMEPCRSEGMMFSMCMFLAVTVSSVGNSATPCLPSDCSLHSRQYLNNHSTSILHVQGYTVAREHGHAQERAAFRP
jgi:hypothetical protein